MIDTMLLEGLIGAPALLATGAIFTWAEGTKSKTVDDLWQRLTDREEEEGDAERFDETMVADLPEPVRRYLLHAIMPGIPLAYTVEIESAGTIRTVPDSPWQPWTAEEIVALPQGFIWKGHVHDELLRVRALDYYVTEEGRRASSRLWGTVPSLWGENDDVARSARGRMALEACLSPASLLPSRGVRWEAPAPDTARAHFVIDGEEQHLTLHLDPGGRLLRAETQRWGRPGGQGAYRAMPFSVEVLEEKTFGGYTIPCRISVAWDTGADTPFEYFQAEIKRAVFR